MRQQWSDKSRDVVNDGDDDVDDGDHDDESIDDGDDDDSSNDFRSEGSDAGLNSRR